MTQFEEKDPYENPVLEFDFAGELESISGTPVITVTTINSIDPDAISILSGALQISGMKVLQRVDNGLNLVNYKFVCKATDGVNKRVRTGILPVRTA